MNIHVVLENDYVDVDGMTDSLVIRFADYQFNGGRKGYT